MTSTVFAPLISVALLLVRLRRPSSYTRGCLITVDFPLSPSFPNLRTPSVTMPLTTITYTLHPTPSPASSSSSVLHNAVAGIKAHLPLRNLHWKSSSRTSLRTIQEVDIDLVDLGEVTSLRDKNVSVLDSPLVNMCLVVCEVRHHVQEAMTIQPADAKLALRTGRFINHKRGTSSETGSLSLQLAELRTRH